MLVFYCILIWLAIGFIGGAMYNFDEESKIMGLKKDWLWFIVAMIGGVFSVKYAIRFNREVEKDKKKKTNKDEQ
jgi:hypothetical protein